MATISDYLENLQAQINLLKENLRTKGCQVSDNEKIDTLVPKVLEIVGAEAFKNIIDRTIQEVSIPMGVKVIGANAFAGCTLLESASIPSSVEKIGYQSFDGCDLLKNISISNGVKSIEGYAFNSCDLSSIEIPDSVTSLGYDVLAYNYNLTYVKFGSGITSIDTDLFSGCSELKKVYINNTKKNVYISERHNQGINFIFLQDPKITAPENVVTNETASVGEVVYIYPVSSTQIIVSFDLNGVTKQGDSFIMPDRDVVITNVVMKERPPADAIIETPHPYISGMNVTYTSPELLNATEIRVTFDDQCEIENNYDYPTLVYPDGTEKQLKYGGEIAGKTYIIPGNKAVIKFHSDGSTERYGIKAYIWDNAKFK